MARRARRWRAASAIAVAAAMGLLGLYACILAGADVLLLASAVFVHQAEQSPEAKVRLDAVARRIASASDDGTGFFVKLDGEDLAALAMAYLHRGYLRDLDVAVLPDSLAFRGRLGDWLGVPASGRLAVYLESGMVQVEVEEMAIGHVPVPGSLLSGVQQRLGGTLDLSRLADGLGPVRVQHFVLQDGHMALVGVHQRGSAMPVESRPPKSRSVTLSGDALSAAPPGGDTVPTGGAWSAHGPQLYLALGDALASSAGVSMPQEGYVSRFHTYLQKQAGRPMALLNLSAPGDSSITLKEGQLRQALAEIARRRHDGDPATSVAVLTLDVGASDLLGHLGSVDCQAAPEGQVCWTRIEGALAAFKANFQEVVAALAAALEPGAEFYVLTLYNPYDLGGGTPFELLSTRTVTRVNDFIRRVGDSEGALVADAYSGMKGHAATWTHMLSGSIHPNAMGYQAIAFSLVQARERAQALGRRTGTAGHGP